MKEALRYGFILAAICVVASGLLAGVNLLANPRIIAQAQAEEQDALKEVMPQGDYFEPVKDKEEVLYYKVFDKENKFIGVAFKASGKGYSSVIDTLTGMALDGKITAIKVLSQNETPGLGANITDPSFAGKFTNRDIRDLAGIQGITGATISSRAVISSVEAKAKEIQGLIKDVSR